MKRVMLFPTLEFFIFFSIVFFLSIFLRYYQRVYKVFIATVSTGFYLFWGPVFTSLLVFDIVINYFVLLTYKRAGVNQRLMLGLGVALNVLILGFFKYFNFFTDASLALAHYFGWPVIFPVFEIAAPIGISFYTFKIISHLVDTYRSKVSPSGFFDYFCYVSFFPQVSAGPIARAKEFYEDLNNEGNYGVRKNYFDSNQAAVLVFSGLLKKYVLASFLFEIVQGPFSIPAAYGSVDLILGAVAYSCLIYTDFSGYSDLSMAISNLLGFRSPQNFVGPYASTSIIDFWRTWHISLSSWLKDYLYIPLGGNRLGNRRKYLNLFLTMTVGGIWHGAGLQFVIWGMLHGVGLTVNHLWKGIIGRGAICWTESFVARITSWIMTFSFVTFAWIFFNAKSMGFAWQYVGRIWHLSATESRLLTPGLVLVLLVTLGLNLTENKGAQVAARTLSRLGWLAKYFVFLTATTIILLLGPARVAPFIYFNF